MAIRCLNQAILLHNINLNLNIYSPCETHFIPSHFQLFFIGLLAASLGEYFGATIHIYSKDQMNNHCIRQIAKCSLIYSRASPIWYFIKIEYYIYIIIYLHKDLSIQYNRNIWKRSIKVNIGIPEEKAKARKRLAITKAYLYGKSNRDPSNSKFKSICNIFPFQQQDLLSSLQGLKMRMVNIWGNKILINNIIEKEIPTLIYQIRVKSV